MNSERAVVSARTSYVREKLVELPRGQVEVRTNRWLAPVEDTFSLDGVYLVGMALTPRPGPAYARFVDEERAYAPRALGKVWFVPPDRRLKTDCIEGQHRSICCLLSPAVGAGVFTHLRDADDRLLRDGLEIRSPDIEWMLHKVHRSTASDGFAASLLIETVLDALAVEVVRHLKGRESDQPRRRGGLSQRRLRLIQDRVKSDEPAPSLGELAEICRLTSRHLTRAFKEETGETIGKYVEAMTVERAHRMLASGTKPIAEIAIELGFASASSFSSAFRRKTGRRPSDIGRTARRTGRA